MYITSNKDKTYHLWTNDRKLIATNKSQKEIEYILCKYMKKEKENYDCRCLLCKNGIEHSTR
jgi:hypothetical protein